MQSSDNAHSWRIGLAAVALAGATLLAYSNSLHAPFLFDDTKSLLQNPSILHVGSALTPPENLGVGGRPIVNLTFAINYALGGFSVVGYHVVNVLIHVGAALALFGILRRTFGQLLPAVAAAAIWALHPVQTISVTYLSERSESLMGLFYLLSLYCFIRGWPWRSAIACYLAVMGKEVAATAPLLILLYDRTFVSGTFRSAWKGRQGYYLGLAGSWLVVALLMAGLSQRGAGLSLGVTPFTYACTEARAVLHYLRLSVIPYPLVFDSNQAMVSFAAALPAILAILALIAAAIRLLRSPALKSVGFALAAFFLLLAPTSSVVPVAIQPVAENRLYLPLAGIVVIVVLALTRWLGKAGIAVALGLGVVAAGATIARNDDYRSAVSIWSDTVAKAPNNARAFYNLGSAYLDTGDVSQAVGALQSAAALNPNDAETHFNLGVALARGGRSAEAAGQYRQTLALKPTFSSARENLAILLAGEGQGEDALALLQTAVRQNPTRPEAHFNFANALVAANQAEAAMAEYARACELAPANADFHRGWGMALAKLAHPAEAIAQYEQALRLRPTYSEAEYNLANALMQSGNLPEAITHYRAAATELPTNPSAHANLGAALASSGQMAEAVKEFEQAARLSPNDPQIQQNLEMARKALANP